jgi:hypothetical protein
MAEYALVPVDRLREHEETDPRRVEEVRSEIQRSGIVDEPVLVSRESLVILNGHHRCAALRALGAVRVPVFLVEYETLGIRLERWSPGPPISKSEVVQMAASGRRFPPKTTRHIVSIPLPRQPTLLRDLLDHTRASAHGHPRSR